MDAFWVLSPVMVGDYIRNQNSIKPHTGELLNPTKQADFDCCWVLSNRTQSALECCHGWICRTNNFFYKPFFNENLKSCHVNDIGRGTTQKKRLLPCYDLVLEGMDGERGDRERWKIAGSMQRKMSQKTETHPMRGKKHLGNWNETHLLCMFVCACLQLQVSEYIWSSGCQKFHLFFYGGIFRVFCDLRQRKKGGVVIKTDNGGCRQQGTR